MYIFAPKIEPAEYFFDCTSIHLIMIRQKYGLILESRLHISKNEVNKNCINKSCSSNLIKSVSKNGYTFATMYIQ